MHRSAHDFGRLFFETHWKTSYHRILDVGAMDVNGTLRDFCPPCAEYVGADMDKGKGVDVVLNDPHAFPFENDAFDVVLSSSCFEHDDMFWLTFAEACRVLKPGGLFYVNVPSNGIYHTYPYDMWRFYPDSGVGFARWGQRCGYDIHLVESFISGGRSGSFNDCVMIFKKGLPDEGDTKIGLSDKVQRAFNIRKFGSEKVSNYSKPSPDLLEVEQLLKENASLKERLLAALAKVPAA
jgi:SAM-dependent methyltransferase